MHRYAEISLTSKPNTWLEPHAIRHVPFLHLEDIDFAAPEQSTKDYKQLQCLSKPNPILHDKPNCKQNDLYGTNY